MSIVGGVGSGLAVNRMNTAGMQTGQESALLDKLASRVFAQLDEAGITIQGSGPFALDLDENGSVVVIGDIVNKDEVESVVNRDPELAGLLARAISASASGNPSREETPSGWPQNAYEVELSENALQLPSAGAATESFTRQARSALRQTTIEPIQYDTSKPWITVTDTGRGGEYDDRYGPNPNSFEPDGIEPLSTKHFRPGKDYPVYMPTTQAGYVLECGNEHMSSSGKLLTLFGLPPVADSYRKGIEGPEVMKETRVKIGEHLAQEKKSLFDDIGSILKQNGITLNEQDDIQISLDKDGKIVVDGGSAKARQIESVLQEKGGEELAGRLKTLALKEAAFSAYLDHDFHRGMGDKGDNSFIPDDLALALLQDKTGVSADGLYTVEGNPDMENSAIASLNESAPGVAYSVLSAGRGQKAAEFETGFTMSADGLRSSYDPGITGKLAASAKNIVTDGMNRANQAIGKDEAWLPSEKITSFDFLVDAAGNAQYLSGSLESGAALPSATIKRLMEHVSAAGMRNNQTTGYGNGWGVTKDVAAALIDAYAQEHRGVSTGNLAIKASYRDGTTMLDVVEKSLA